MARVSNGIVSSHLAGLNYLVSTEGGTSGSRARDLTIKAVRLYQRDRWRTSLARRRWIVDQIPLDRPIFFLGVQGAGETIIGRCLRRNEAVVSMSGNSGYWTGIDELGVVRNRMARLPVPLWGCKYRTDIEHPLYGSNHNSIYACDDLLPFYRQTADDADGADGARFRRLLREHIRVYAGDPRRARFFDKTHTNTLKLPLLAAYLRGCEPLFVLVVRNPYSWCHRAVLRKRPSYRVSLSAEEELRLTAEHWSNSYRIALDDARRIPNVTAVRFEEFIGNPEATIRRLCTFLGLEFESSMVPRARQALPFATLPGDRKWYPLRTDPWLASVTDRTAEIVASHCGPLAARFGYSRSPAETSEDRARDSSTPRTAEERAPLLQLPDH